MAADECKYDSVTRADAPGLRVRDAMNTAPKTVPADATVAEVQEIFDNSRVLTAIVVDGPEFVGAVHRDALRGEASDPVGGLAQRDVDTTEPDAALTDALARLDADGERRLVVLDPDGRTLRGLLCLTRDRNGFCQS